MYVHAYVASAWLKQDISVEEKETGTTEKMEDGGNGKWVVGNDRYVRT
jgi:hypothetical protein